MHNPALQLQREGERENNREQSGLARGGEGGFTVPTAFFLSDLLLKTKGFWNFICIFNPPAWRMLVVCLPSAFPVFVITAVLDALCKC